MKVRGWLLTTLLVMVLLGTGCSRQNFAIVAQADSEGEGGAIPIPATTGLAFEVTEAQAPADQEFAVEFVHPGGISHNWVLVEEGQEEAALEAADATGAIANDAPGVIAASAVLTGGSEEVLVEPLPAGEYVYICTVPGHYVSGMLGTLIVGQ